MYFSDIFCNCITNNSIILESEEDTSTVKTNKTAPKLLNSSAKAKVVTKKPADSRFV